MRSQGGISSISARILRNKRSVLLVSYKRFSTVAFDTLYGGEKERNVILWSNAASSYVFLLKDI